MKNCIIRKADRVFAKIACKIPLYTIYIAQSKAFFFRPLQNMAPYTINKNVYTHGSGLEPDGPFWWSLCFFHMKTRLKNYVLRFFDYISLQDGLWPSLDKSRKYVHALLSENNSINMGGNLKYFCYFSSFLVTLYMEL